MISATKPFPSSMSGENFFVRLNENSKKLLLLFSAKDLAPNKFNFWQLGLELPVNLIFLNNGRNEWYQNGIPDWGNSFAETLEMLRAWVDSLGIEEVYAMGTSMGGYAAIQYGVPLDARILTFSLDVKLSSPYSRSTRFMTKSNKPICNDLREIIPLSRKAIQTYVGEGDPSDIWQASLLRDIPQIEVTSLLGVDHYVPSYLSRSSRLATLMRQLVTNNHFSKLSNAGQALEIADFPDLIFSAYKLFREKKWTECEKTANKALEIYPYADAALFLKGMALVKQEQFSKAAIMFSLASSMAPHNADYVFYCSHALRKDNAPLQALFMLDQMLTKWPGHDRAHYARGIILSSNGDSGAALRSFQTALRLAPQNKSYIARVKKQQ